MRGKWRCTALFWIFHTISNLPTGDRKTQPTTIISSTEKSKDTRYLICMSIFLLKCIRNELFICTCKLGFNTFSIQANRRMFTYQRSVFLPFFLPKSHQQHTTCTSFYEDFHMEHELIILNAKFKVLTNTEYKEKLQQFRSASIQENKWKQMYIIKMNKT